jgi:hypothetical protein
LNLKKGIKRWKDRNIEFPELRAANYKEKSKEAER